jgi:hypothetical protein
MARLNLVGSYLKAVARHWVWLVVAAVGAVGNGATLFGDFVVPRWIWWGVFALGVVVAQFLAYADVSDDLAFAKARLRELNTDETRRAYLDEQLGRAKRLQERIEALSSSGRWDFQTRRTCRDDIGHWESGVRADLRESFADGTDLLFDSNDGFIAIGAHIGSAETDIEYLDWRIARLLQIKENL